MMPDLSHLRAQEHFFPQVWLMTACVVVFAAYVSFDRGYLQLMVSSDRSGLSLLIVAIFLVASSHAAWHIFAVSARLRAAEQRSREPGAGGADGFVASFLADLEATPGDGDGVVEIHADRLRSPVEIGWFVVDVLIRLGLVGTIVGFILMLASLTDAPMPKSDDIRLLLISMSGGMGTALYTTLAGLVAATLLGVQYMILGRCVEHLVAGLIRLRRRGA
jgi:hypothetical protein